MGRARGLGAAVLDLEKEMSPPLHRNPLLRVWGSIEHAPNSVKGNFCDHTPSPSGGLLAMAYRLKRAEMGRRRGILAILLAIVAVMVAIWLMLPSDFAGP
jgi:hypothetical protein